MKNISLIAIALALLSVATVGQNIRNFDSAFVYDAVEGLRSPHLYTDILWL